jgi:hypothetical protein
MSNGEISAALEKIKISQILAQVARADGRMAFVAGGCGGRMERLPSDSTGLHSI